MFEEMQRVLRFLDWHTKWWMERSTIASIDRILSDGHQVYAEHQAELRCQISTSFAHTWRDTQHFLNIANTDSASLQS